MKHCFVSGGISFCVQTLGNGQGGEGFVLEAARTQVGGRDLSFEMSLLQETSIVVTLEPSVEIHG